MRRELAALCFNAPKAASDCTTQVSFSGLGNRAQKQILMQPSNDTTKKQIESHWKTGKSETLRNHLSKPTGKPEQDIVGLFFNDKTLMAKREFTGDTFMLVNNPTQEFWAGLNFAVWCKPGGERIRQVAFTEPSRAPGPAAAIAAEGEADEGVVPVRPAPASAESITTPVVAPAKAASGKHTVSRAVTKKAASCLKGKVRRREITWSEQLEAHEFSEIGVTEGKFEPVSDRARTKLKSRSGGFRSPPLTYVRCPNVLADKIGMTVGALTLMLFSGLPCWLVFSTRMSPLDAPSPASWLDGMC